MIDRDIPNYSLLRVALFMAQQDVISLHAQEVELLCASRTERAEVVDAIRDRCIVYQQWMTALNALLGMFNDVVIALLFNYQLNEECTDGYLVKEALLASMYCMQTAGYLPQTTIPRTTQLFHLVEEKTRDCQAQLLRHGEFFPIRIHEQHTQLRQQRRCA